MYQVFISHSSKDFPQAQAIVRYLEEQGIRCWIAPRDIQLGSSFGSSISAAIPECPVFLPLLSQNYMASTHVEKELILAENDRSKHILPMKLEDCPVVDPFDFHFANLQIKNLYLDREKELADLLGWIRQILFGSAPESADARFQKGMTLYDQQNYGDAVKQFTEAAKQGSLEAINMLGICHSRGHGVPPDQRQAAAFYEMAAKQGFAIAQLNIGRCYQEGDGVNKNDALAVEWLQKASDQGIADAQNALSVYYHSGNVVKRDYRAAVLLLEKAVEQNHPMAQFNLGFCYENGQGVNKDIKKAKALYQKAAEQGCESAQKALERLNKPWFLR